MIPSWYLFRDSASPFRFLILPRRTVSTPRCHHGHLSSTASPIPMTFFFRIARRRHTDLFFSVCCSPSIWSSGFSHPRCYQRFLSPESLVLPVNLPPSAPPRFGVSSSSRFAVVAGNINNRTGGLPWVRRTTSPYSVRLPVGSVLRISGLA